MEPGGERRLARPGWPHESHCPAVDFDRVGVQREQPALVQEHAKGRSEEEQANVALRHARFGIDSNPLAGFYSIARDLRDNENEPAIHPIEAIGFAVGDDRDRAQLDGDIGRRTARCRKQLRKLHIATDAKSENRIVPINRRSCAATRHGKAAISRKPAASSPPITAAPPTLTHTCASSRPNTGSYRAP